MKDFYIIFGTDNFYERNGKILNSEKTFKIKAESFSDARRIAFDKFGQKWVFVNEDVVELDHGN